MLLWPALVNFWPVRRTNLGIRLVLGDHFESTWALRGEGSHVISARLCSRDPRFDVRFSPATIAVSGILSSCPRVMPMQCWKSSVPPPLSTRLRIYWFVGFLGLCRQKEKKHDSVKFPSEINTQRQVKTHTAHVPLIPQIPQSQEYQMNTHIS